MSLIHLHLTAKNDAAKNSGGLRDTLLQISPCHCKMTLQLSMKAILTYDYKILDMTAKMMLQGNFEAFVTYFAATFTPDTMGLVARPLVSP